ncbi:MBL fold hydrolase [Candidatus Bathyarchaeota archaeon]|nr:MAG: MBL fold hydrolase [Candidatus Bathyarchaeota archaeon]
MKLKILYDNEAKAGFRSGWGFSCLVGGNLLFDTGADLETLLFNMRRLNVKLDRIDKVFFSHEHGDHIGGFQIVGLLGEVEAFVLRSFSKRFKSALSSYTNVRLREVSKPQEISTGMFTTGEQGFFIKEQSLIVETDKGVVVVTGCSHPGLEKILGFASRFGNVYGVVGGFHGFRKLEALRGVKLIVPCHCTVRKREILTLYPNSSIRCSAGCEIEV